MSACPEIYIVSSYGTITNAFIYFRGSRELLEDSGNNLSASDSDSPVPTCMPFSWFGDSHKEPQVSGSGLHFAQSGQDNVSEQGQEKNKSKVNVYK